MSAIISHHGPAYEKNIRILARFVLSDTLMCNIHTISIILIFNNFNYLLVKITIF